MIVSNLSLVFAMVILERAPCSNFWVWLVICWVCWGGLNLTLSFYIFATVFLTAWLSPRFDIIFAFSSFTETDAAETGRQLEDEGNFWKSKKLPLSSSRSKRVKSSSSSRSSFSFKVVFGDYFWNSWLFRDLDLEKGTTKSISREGGLGSYLCSYIPLLLLMHPRKEAKWF